MTYTTQELSEILSKTQIDSITNKPLLMPESDRILSEKAQSDDAPEMGKILYQIGGSEALIDCFNYWTIREQVREYQRQHNISGLISNSFKCRGQEITYLEWHDQLILQDWDVQSLTNGASAIVGFFLEVVKDYDLFLDEGECDEDQTVPMPKESILRHAASAVSCFIYSQSLQWSKEAIGEWEDPWVGRFIDRDEPDKIFLAIHLDRPDNPKAECVRVVAKHRDTSRYPWIESSADRAI